MDEWRERPESLESVEGVPITFYDTSVLHDIFVAPSLAFASGRVFNESRLCDVCDAGVAYVAHMVRCKCVWFFLLLLV